MKIIYSLLLFFVFYSLTAEKITVSGFDPVSEHMQLSTAAFSCRFAKHHAFPFRFALADGKKIPFFDFADAIIQPRTGKIFTVSEDYWCEVTAHPEKGVIESKGVFCSRRWKPHPEVYPGAEIRYQYTLSSSLPHLRIVGTIRNLTASGNIRLRLLALRWQKTDVYYLVLSPGNRIIKLPFSKKLHAEKQIEIHFKDTAVRLEADSFTIDCDGTAIRITPEHSDPLNSKIAISFLKK